MASSVAVATVERKRAPRLRSPPLTPRAVPMCFLSLVVDHCTKPGVTPFLTSNTRRRGPRIGGLPCLDAPFAALLARAAS